VRTAGDPQWKRMVCLPNHPPSSARGRSAHPRGRNGAERSEGAAEGGLTPRRGRSPRALLTERSVTAALPNLCSTAGRVHRTENIAKNVLQEQGVPAERLDDVLDSILEGAKSVGFIRDWGGKRYLDLAGIASSEAIGARDRGAIQGMGNRQRRLYRHRRPLLLRQSRYSQESTSTSRFILRLTRHRTPLKRYSGICAVTF